MSKHIFFFMNWLFFHSICALLAYINVHIVQKSQVIIIKEEGHKKYDMCIHAKRKTRFGQLIYVKYD